jgi:hypothetical protein
MRDWPTKNLDEGRVVSSPHPALLCRGNPYGWQTMAVQNASAALVYDAFGLIGTTFRDELDWKMLIFFEKAVPIR